mgnify:FL=1
MAQISGWGRGAWNEGAWGEALPVEVTGVSSQTNVGSVTVAIGINVQPTGVSSQTNVGSVTVAIGSDVQVSGNEVETDTGTVSLVTDQIISVTGFQTNIALQNLIISGDGSITVTAAEDQMDFSIGSVIAEAESIVDTVTGVSASIGLPGNPNEYSAQGTTALSTDQAKFGVSSVEFDGSSGQGVQQNVSTGYASGDFTSEFFVYSSTIESQTGNLWDNRNPSFDGLNLLNTNGQLSFFKNGAGGSSPAGVLSNNTWHHIAIVRSGSTGNVYVDGVLQITRNIGTTDYSTRTVLLGNDTTSSFRLNGYIDEYRDSNIVRYSSNFTPPTSAFTVDANTTSLLHFDGTDGSTVIVNSAAPESIDVTGTAVITPTGVESPAETGTLTVVADSNFEVSGVSMQFADGDSTVAAGAIATPTGISISTNTGSVVIESAYSFTGVSMQFADGTPTTSGSAVITPIGLNANISVGNMFSTPWANVNTNASNTWTPVAA